MRTRFAGANEEEVTISLARMATATSVPLMRSMRGIGVAVGACVGLGVGVGDEAGVAVWVGIAVTRVVGVTVGTIAVGEDVGAACDTAIVGVKERVAVCWTMVGRWHAVSPRRTQHSKIRILISSPHNDTSENLRVF